VIDSHTHLASCEGTDADLVAAAQAAGVTKMLTVGTDMESCEKALAAAEAHPGIVHAAIGLHPNSASGFSDADAQWLTQLARHPACVAVGETGIDLYRDGASLEDQQRAFIFQCDLARELDLALVIHTRAADEETLSILDAHAEGLRVILHCFSMAERITECVDRGYWISFAGNVTYPSAGDLRLAAVSVPAERLLVETDAPYLSPQPVRKERNRPEFVVHTAAAVAAERRAAAEDFDAAVEAAAEAVFRW
jgi:TatD DNase family protein